MKFKDSVYDLAIAEVKLTDVDGTPRMSVDFNENIPDAVLNQLNGEE